LGIIVFFY